MYDELIKRLRDAAKMSEALAVLLPHSEGNATAKLFNEAADAIEELQKDLKRSKDFEAFWQHEAEEALKKFQVAISNKQKWIPVTERLPDIADMVLVCSESGLVIDTAWRTAFSIPSGAWDTYSGILDPASITHWMPLPEPPDIMYYPQAPGITPTVIKPPKDGE